MTETNQPNDQWYTDPDIQPFGGAEQQDGTTVSDAAGQDQGRAAGQGGDEAAPGDVGGAEELDQREKELRDNLERFGEATVKFAQEAGFAVAGFAGLVGDKAKAFYEDQKKQYAETHPDAEKDPGAKEFLTQLSDRLNKFVDDLTRGFRDMADRGRESFDKRPDEPAGGPPAAADMPSMVDTDSDLYEEPVTPETPSSVADDEARNDL